MTPIEEEIIKFLRAQAEADVKGAVGRIEDNQERLYNLFAKQEEEHKQEFLALHGEIRGVSMRVGALERGKEALDERTRHLEARNSKHEEDIDESHRWIIGDLDRKVKKAEGTFSAIKDPRNIVAIIAGLWAAATTLYHFLH